MPDAVEANDASCMSDEAVVHEHHGHSSILQSFQYALYSIVRAQGDSPPEQIQHPCMQ